MTHTLEPAALTSSDYDLADRYRSGRSGVLLTGVQAIARLLVEQHAADAARGLKTGIFVSGYQGSPLGGVDRMLAGMPDVLDENDIHFVSGLNEELAATAVWGSQSAVDPSTAKNDGVVGIWYGKGPGVDRATDSLRHANMYGTNPNGGMLLLVGDDPASKSSTVPAVSERSLAALHIPVLFPRNAAEIVTLGRHGIEMSRSTGTIVALKIVADVADGSWRLDDLPNVDPVAPRIVWANRTYTYVQHRQAVSPDAIVAVERDLVGPRRALIEAYGRDNQLDHVDLDTGNATIGIIAAGTTYDSVRQAMRDIGATDDALAAAGVRILRLGLIWPVNATTIKAFTHGLQEVIVVEDKTSFIETQLRDLLYGQPAAPLILGKRDRDGQPLMPEDGELNPARLLAPMRHVLEGRVDLRATRPTRIDLPLLPNARAPYFCSGCPHNRSTAIPDGSLAAGGIGCHIMVTTSPRTDSAVTGITQMGGEGAQWIGQAAFTDTEHVFQNVGDGTYFHSAQLALQACVAAGVNITYKILWNEVVAMTGAQDAEGAIALPNLAHKLTREGVARIIVCADEPARHRRRDFPRGTKIWPRTRLDEAQRLLRDIEGVTVLIYDQHCAADARRQRKRGQLAPRPTRVVINEAVCEGCGDCGRKSNCLSVQPVETEYGRKTRIDQTSCNTDYSCLEGDCPSFVTVHEAPRAQQKAARRRTAPKLPDLPAPPAVDLTATRNIFMAGIGGTGIVTVNQVLATAAVRAGMQVHGLDQTGLSQKAGPVTSHLRFSAGGIDPSNRLTPGEADCLLAFDLLTAADNRNLQYGSPAKTILIASTSRTPTGQMVYDPDVQHPDDDDLLARLRSVTAHSHHFDALWAAQRLFGHTTTANFLLVGAAIQAGAIGLPADAVEEAIEINGVSVTANIEAFRWGRVAVSDPSAFDAAVGALQVDGGGSDRPDPRGSAFRSDMTARVPDDMPKRLADLVTRRAIDLAHYQDRKTAYRYIAQVGSVRRHEENAVGDDTTFSETVARHLYKLTAYKDEYEVARLLTDPLMLEATRAAVPGGTDVTFNLHPPALRALGMQGKLRFGPRTHVLLRTLARAKFLRGTPMDPFGRAHVRRVERSLVEHYWSTVDDLAQTLTSAGFQRAVDVANAPDLVRGYEGVKLRNVDRYVSHLRSLSVDTSALEAILED